MWPRLLSTAIGIWLTAAPGVLGYGGPARTHDLVIGPIVIAAAIVAMSEVMRALRWINVATGIWMILAPFALSFPSTATAQSIIAGAVLAAVASIRGRQTQRYADGWMALFTRSTAGH